MNRLSQIAMNGRFLFQTMTGVQRYAMEVSSRFEEQADVISPNRFHSGIAGHIWEQSVLASRVRGRCLWSPANTGPLAIERQVVTIHDAATLDHPEWFQSKFSIWYRTLLPRLIKRVRKVITVSEFSRLRLLEHTGVPESMVVAIPNGVDSRFRRVEVAQIDALRRRLELPESYLLVLGSLEPRKNLFRLFKAWEQLTPALRDVHLVVAGATAQAFSSVGYERVPPRVKMLGYVPDEQLPALYSGALAFVYPSLYEGFGLPPLEALACGTPVVTSNATALPEVVGDAALFVDPCDVDSIAWGITRIVEDAALRSALAERGVQRASRFRWQQTADLTWATLMEVAGQSV